MFICRRCGFILLALIMGLVCSPVWVAAQEQKAVKIDKLDFEVAKSLKEREADIDRREKRVQDQEKELKQLREDVEGKLARLVQLQNELKDQLAALNDKRDAQFNNLIKVYSTMSASKAAPLLNKMEDEVVVKILRAMKTDLVAKIIPKLNPEKAVTVSTSLGMLRAN